MFSYFIQLLLVMAGFGVTAAVAAQTTGPDLARASNCLACHQIDKKRVGPALTVIADRFAGGGEGAREYLAKAIRSGSRGNWGAVPMPAQTQVSPENARLLAEWILSLASAQPAAAAGAPQAPAPTQ